MRQPVLRVFDLHEPDLANVPPRDHRARLTDQRIAGVVMGQDKERVCLFGGGGQLLCLGHRGGQRLVADDVDAALEELDRRGGVHVVRRDDGHRLNPVLSARLAPGHPLPVVIGPRRIKPDFRARGPRPFGG